MENLVQQRPDSRPYDNWTEFMNEIIANANETVKGVKYLYRTNVQGLEDIYLNNLPEDAQHYNCNACKAFLSRYGSLVVIKDNQIVPVFWSGKTKHTYFSGSVKKMYDAVKSAKITNVFTFNENDLNDTKLFGINENKAHLTGFVWSHFHYPVPASLEKNLLHRSKYLERYEMLNRIAAEVKIETIDLAVSLINSGVVYRGEEDLHSLKTIRDLITEMSAIKKNREIVVWSMVFGNEALYHLRGSALFTFLEDLATLKDMSGKVDTDKAIDNYGFKKDPTNYGRVKTEVSPTQITITKKFMESKGLTNALKRRFVRTSELPKNSFLWLNKGVQAQQKHQAQMQDDDSGFGNIKPKSANKVDNTASSDNAVKMTWNKFARTILPDAKEIEVNFDNPSRLVGLTTEMTDGAGNLFQWNNPFAWYYNGGNADGEMAKRVINAGGQYDNNDIRCTLLWNNTTDLDVHCITPHGEEVYFSNKRARRSTCWLDVDMNVHGETNKPVENIRLTRGTAPNGRYKFWVNNFRSRHTRNPFKCELEVNGRIYTFEADDIKNNADIYVFEFDYNNGNVTFVRNVNYGVTSNSMWGLNNTNKVKVNGIITSPNAWENTALKQSHVIFLLDGCKDDSNTAKGFMPEFLHSDLKPHRKVLEHYTMSNAVNSIDGADAFGIGYNQDTDWNLKLTVKTNSLTQSIIIDRFE